MNAERVRSLVMDSAARVVGHLVREEDVEAIADLAAEQLAGVGIGLSAEERRQLAYLVGWCNASVGDVIVQPERFRDGIAALDRLLAAPPAVDACSVEPFSSRACEHGTKSCAAEHGPAVDYLGGIRTILASDLPGEAMRKALEELVGLR